MTEGERRESRIPEMVRAGTPYSDEMKELRGSARLADPVDAQREMNSRFCDYITRIR